MSKPNPDCPDCGGTGYYDPMVGKEPCHCWRTVQGYTDQSSGHDEAHDDRGRLDEVEAKYGGDREEKL
jgi:hypothetical protein